MTLQEAIKILDDKVLLLPTCPDIVREAVYMAIEALRTRNVPDKNVGDMISRQAAIDAAMNDSLIINAMDSVKDGDIHRTKRAIARLLASLPPAQPKQLYDAYMKEVLTWLLDYQNTAAKLKGRYFAYQVLSWVVNDWRREHE